MFIECSCSVLLSCIQLCIFSVSFGFVYSCDVICVEGFPYIDQIQESFIVIVYCMYSLHLTLSTFSLISLFKLPHSYQRHDIAFLC